MTLREQLTTKVIEAGGRLTVRSALNPIATSGPLLSLLEAIRTRERRRAELEEQIRHLSNDRAGEREQRPAELRERLLARLADWEGLLTRHPERARETVLRPLLAGRVVLTPSVTAEGRFYACEGKLSFGALVTGLIGTGNERAMTVVPPG